MRYSGIKSLDTTKAIRVLIKLTTGMELVITEVEMSNQLTKVETKLGVRISNKSKQEAAQLIQEYDICPSEKILEAIAIALDKAYLDGYEAANTGNLLNKIFSKNENNNES